MAKIVTDETVLAPDWKLALWCTADEFVAGVRHYAQRLAAERGNSPLGNLTPAEAFRHAISCEGYSDEDVASQEAHPKFAALLAKARQPESAELRNRVYIDYHNFWMHIVFGVRAAAVPVAAFSSTKTVRWADGRISLEGFALRPRGTPSRLEMANILTMIQMQSSGLSALAVRDGWASLHDPTSRPLDDKDWEAFQSAILHRVCTNVEIPAEQRQRWLQWWYVVRYFVESLLREPPSDEETAPSSPAAQNESEWK